MIAKAMLQTDHQSETYPTDNSSNLGFETGSDQLTTGTLEAESPVSSGMDASVTNTSPLPTILLGFGTVVLMLTIFRMLRSTSKARSTRSYKTETPREAIDRFRTESMSSREPLDTMMAEADELARRLATMLDAKAARLDALIADAERHIAALDAVVRVSSSANGHARETISGSIESQVLSLADAGHDAMVIANRLNRPAAEVELILALRHSYDQRGD